MEIWLPSLLLWFLILGFVELLNSSKYTIQICFPHVLSIFLVKTHTFFNFDNIKLNRKHFKKIYDIWMRNHNCMKLNKNLPFWLFPGSSKKLQINGKAVSSLICHSSYSSNDMVGDKNITILKKESIRTNTFYFWKRSKEDIKWKVKGTYL